MRPAPRRVQLPEAFIATTINIHPPHANAIDADPRGNAGSARTIRVAIEAAT